jgi:hypothetical protein
VTRILTMDETANELRVSRRWLQDFLKSAPPCWLEAGRKKLFDERAIAEIRRAIDVMPVFDKMQTLYFVGFDEYVKIGIAADVSVRLRTLQTACPKSLIVYATVRGSVREEQALHCDFARYRLQGEWFTYCKPIADRIAVLSRMDANISDMAEAADRTRECNR